MSAHYVSLESLRELMDTLNGPDGCPWDREQTHESLRQYLIEEAYEVVDSIDAGDDEELMEELGDVLLQVFFHSDIASRRGAFTIDDVARTLHEKMVRRHPHIFGSNALESADEVLQQWGEIKAAEKRERTSVLDGVPRHLPALARAYKFQKRAAKTGFDWPDAEGTLVKLEEEIGELRDAIQQGKLAEIEAEMGDVLFSVVNCARKLGVEPETALNRTNQKFARRFRQVEERLAQAGGKADIEELDRFWNEIKEQERSL
ncbi:nucleoside triphosphate pyrophosphohydrolase [Desulfurispirillum indicum]|uniref:Nucleoside triphosphate pyrophosphohydrolase n=1 Tax=Desulfurispirillum indicum (strain ATCC BAA-1389 / DSM 22839 / S5) TaxID=653733 RepID=E6W0F3_DESIS|nr:nucleoside triphosphate pyrophosphohydrolase [Desulfurispirillum indicum]ADU66371.1 MazG family protein [Desulfurispirillum indicum S5]UCZ55704.1 nucleoside triphosphate pyrophosphohydrolase [Desulfurispirillum indicum]